MSLEDNFLMLGWGLLGTFLVSALCSGGLASGTHDENEFQNRQLRISKWLNWITGLGAIAALAGLWFLNESIQSADRATFVSNRAWIGPLGAALVGDLLPDKPLKAVIRTYNSGKTPALDYQIRYHLRNIRGELIDNGKARQLIDADKICAYDEPDPSGGVMYPYVSDNGVDEEIPLNPPTPENKKVYDEFIFGGWTLVLEVCASYVTFGEPHNSAMCYYYRPGASDAAHLTKCIGGQHAD
jgi:hypothetical protein